MENFKSWKEELQKVVVDSNLTYSDFEAAYYWTTSLYKELKKIFEENNFPEFNTNGYSIKKIEYEIEIIDDCANEPVARISFGEQNGYYAFQVTDLENNNCAIFNLKKYSKEYPSLHTLIQDVLKILNFSIR